MIQLCRKENLKLPLCHSNADVISNIDPKHQERFEQWLCEVNSSDGISLLTALAHMATPMHHIDPAFITTIVLLIYQVVKVDQIKLDYKQTYCINCLNIYMGCIY